MHVAFFWRILLLITLLTYRAVNFLCTKFFWYYKITLCIIQSAHEISLVTRDNTNDYYEFFIRLEVVSIFIVSQTNTRLFLLENLFWKTFFKSLLDFYVLVKHYSSPFVAYFLRRYFSSRLHHLCHSNLSFQYHSLVNHCHYKFHHLQVSLFLLVYQISA